MTSSAVDAVPLAQELAEAAPPLRLLPPVQVLAERLPGDGEDARVEQAQAPQVQHHLRHAAGQEDPHRGMRHGPFGRTLTRRGTRRLTAIQSSTVGRGSPAACAIAGMCSSRLVEPPKAACSAIALLEAGRGQDVAHGPPRLGQGDERAGRAPGHVEPDRLARGRERRVRQGQAQRLADHLRGRGRAEELAAAAGRRAGAAAQLRGLFERDLVPARSGRRASGSCPRPPRPRGAA